VLTVRIIPRLELCSDVVVKEASNLQHLGADELWFWGCHSDMERSNLKSSREALSVPITVACAPRIAEVERALDAGADRVLVPAHESSLIENIAKRFGECACSVALRTEEAASGAMRYRIDLERGGNLGRDPLRWAQQAVECGAGEVVLSAFDKQGARRAPGAELTAMVSAAISVPLVAAGLLAESEFYEALGAGADAVQSDALGKDGACSLPTVKRNLAELGVQVRP